MKRKRFIFFILVSCLCFSFTALAQKQDKNQEKKAETVVEDSKDEIRLTVAGKKLIVENLPEEEVIEIFSVFGVKVHSLRVSAGTNEYQLNLSKGYYILRMGKLVKKVTIK